MACREQGLSWREESGRQETMMKVLFRKTSNVNVDQAPSCAAQIL